jgi:hypothetical protein
MKRFILGFILAISIPITASVLWPSDQFLEVLNFGLKFQSGKILSVLNDVITFDNKRLDDAPKDRVYFQDFEGASVSFSCDANLTKADDTSTPLNESTSVTFTQGSTPPASNAKCTGPTISLPLKAQSKNLVEVCFQATYTGNDNEVAVNVESGGSDLVQVLVEKSSTAKKHCGYFSTISTASVDLDIEILTPNADEVLEIDDVEITIDALSPVDNYASSEWEEYTPTFTGLGTVSNSDCYWKRNGQNADIRCRFVVGTPTATEMRISLPSGLASTSDIDTIQFLGQLERGAQADDVYGVAVEPSSTYLVFTRRTASITGLTAVNGSAIFAAGNAGSFSVSVSIAGWSNTSQGVVVKNRTDSASVENTFSARIANNGTATITSQSVDFIESVSRTGTGVVQVNFKSNHFSEIPTVVDGLESVQTRAMTITALSTTGATISTFTSSGGTLEDRDFSLMFQRQGTDYIKETDKVYTVDVANLRGNWVRAEGNGGESITVDVTPIPFAETTDTASAWDGDEYTVQNGSSQITISGSLFFTTSASRGVHLYKNNVFYKRINSFGTTATAVSFGYKATRGEFAAGDVLELRSNDSGGTLNNDTKYHYLNIVEEYPQEGVFLGTFGQPTCYVKDVKPSGTAGGSAGATTTQTRDLNTTQGNCSFLSLSSNQFTLESGSYEVSCEAPSQLVNRNKAFIYNVTDASTDIVGQSNWSTSTTNNINYANVSGFLNISTSKAYEVRHYTETANASTGLGLATSDGSVEVYTQCKITKVR